MMKIYTEEKKRSKSSKKNSTKQNSDPQEQNQDKTLPSNDQIKDKNCQKVEQERYQFEAQVRRNTQVPPVEDVGNDKVKYKFPFASKTSVKFHVICEAENLYAAIVHMVAPGPCMFLSYTSMKLLERVNPLHLFMRKVGPSNFSACIGTPSPKALEALCIQTIKVGLTYKTPVGIKRTRLELPVTNLGLPMDMRWERVPRAEESILTIMNGTTFEAIVSIHFEQTIQKMASSQILAKYIPSSYCHHDVFVYSSDNHVFLSSSSALAAHSPYFRKYLFENPPIQNPYRVRFPTANCTETHAILRYIHHRDLTMATSELHFSINIYYLTVSLEIPQLQMELEKYLMSEIDLHSDMETLIKLLKFPRHPKFQGIRERVISLLQEKSLRELRNCARLQEAMRCDMELTNEILEGFPPYGNNDALSDITSPELEPFMALSPSPLFMTPPL